MWATQFVSSENISHNFIYLVSMNVFYYFIIHKSFTHPSAFRFHVSSPCAHLSHQLLAFQFAHSLGQVLDHLSQFLHLILQGLQVQHVKQRKTKLV